MELRSALLNRLGVSWRLLLKELSGFGVVGALCFFLELGLFQVLYAHVGLGAVSSKLITTVVSATVAYVGHRYWSFSHRARTGVRREYSIFFVVNGLTLLIALGMVAFVRYGLGEDGTLLLQLTNIASIAVGSVIRYVCYRKWVFVSDDAPAAVAARLHRKRRDDDHGVSEPAAA